MQDSYQFNRKHFVFRVLLQLQSRGFNTHGRLEKYFDNKDIICTNLFTKLQVHGLSKHGVTFVYSHMKRREQGTKINEKESLHKILLTGVTKTTSLKYIFIRFISYRKELNLITLLTITRSTQKKMILKILGSRK